jgi:hypothetical protein
MPWAGPLMGQLQEGMGLFEIIFSVFFFKFAFVFLIDQIIFS